MESQHTHERVIQEQQYQEVKQRAVDQLAQNGGNYGALPAGLRAQLRPSDALAFQEDYDNAERTAREVALRANWLEHPEQQTVAAVKEAYVKGQLTNSSYLSALREATEIQSDPQKVQQVSMDHSQLTEILTVNELPSLAFPKSNADRAGRVELETAIKNEIDVQQQRNNRKLTWVEKGKIARDLIIDKVYSSTPILWMGGTLKPAAILTPEEVQKASVFVGGEKVRLADIPPEYQQEAMQDLQANRLPTTQANIAAWWVKKGKPRQ
jgi:hypothetical protein